MYRINTTFFAKVVEVVPQKSPLEGIDEFES